jgi:PAS domain-containing protein
MASERATLALIRFLPTDCTYAEIAASRYVSVNTVKSQLKSIYRQLGVSSRVSVDRSPSRQRDLCLAMILGRVICPGSKLGMVRTLGQSTLATELGVEGADEDGRLLAVNSAFENLFDIAGSRLPSEPAEDLIIAPRFRAGYRAARRAALAERRLAASRRPVEFVALSADGSEFDIELSIAFVSVNGGQVATWIRDLTEDRTSVVKTLRRAALLERAEELAGLGSWEWEPHTGELQFSDNLFRIFGLAPGEIIPSAQYTIDHCHPDDRARLERALRELDRTGRRPESVTALFGPTGWCVIWRRTSYSSPRSTESRRR